MCMIRLSIKMLFTISLIYGQGIMNSYGIGHFYKNQGLNNAVDGITDLSPSLYNKSSLSNPSTWHNLKFTYLSLSYNANDNSFKNKSIYNGYSSLSNAIWIIPIKSKSSFGISLSPYSNQKVSIVDPDILQSYVFDDTLLVSKSFDRFGGIMAFSVGSSYLLNNRISLGAKLDVLFGSSRQNQAIFFDGSAITKQSRTRYNGILNNLFLSINITKNSTIFTSTMFAIKPLSGTFTEKYLFDDANGNGYHDLNIISDFPHPDSVASSPEYNINSIHNPIEYRIGFNQYIGTNFAASLQISRNEERADNISIIKYPIDDWINNTNSIKVSLIKYSSSLSLKLIDKFSLKTGFKYSNFNLNKSKSMISEFGVSAGMGFKFKAVGNQLDINYYIGLRKHPILNDKESIHQLQFGVSLGDLWFVKRRQK